jgi:hypothetical protein
VAVVAQADPKVDPVNAAILDDAARLLAREKTSLGPMRVHRIPLPDCQDGCYRTYTNVIFANGLLLVPVYSDADPNLQDRALGLYARLLPRWKVVGINADGLAPLGGALRCMSMNVPAFVPLPKIAYRPVCEPTGARGGAMSLEQIPEDSVPPAAFEDAAFPTDRDLEAAEARIAGGR